MKNIFLLLLLFSMFHANGQFGFPQLISNNKSTKNATDFLRTADLDLDGDLDIITTENWGEKTYWLENLDGQGDFSKPKIITTTYSFTQVYFDTGDLDQDGDIDVVLGRSNMLTWFKNEIRNTTTFKDTLDFPAFPSNIQQVSMVDLNNDNIQDIILLMGNDIIWMEGIDGEGNFYDYEILIEGTLGQYRFGDLDGDGDIDFVTGKNVSGTTNKVWYEHLDGVGEFSNSYVTIAPVSSNVFELVDLDNDGDLDLVNSHGSPNLTSWFENENGQGNFGSEITLLENNSVDAFAAVDIDNDNDLDLIFPETYPLLLNNIDGQANFEESLLGLSLIYYAEYIHFADINNDGNQDALVVVNTSTSNRNQFLIAKGRGDGRFENSTELIGDMDKVQYSFFKSEDITGDGYPELVVGHQGYGRLGWYEYENTPRRLTNERIITTMIYSGGYPTSMDYGDLDGDGDKDILCAFGGTFYDDGRVSWFERIDGENSFENEDTLSFNEFNESYSGISDFDGDGDKDILSIINGYPTEVNIYDNSDGAGNFSSSTNINLNNLQFSAFLMTDVDEDGDDDIIAYNQGQEKVYWFQNESGNFSSSVSLIADVEFSGSIFHFKDIDMDGLNDFIYTDFTQANGHQLVYHKNLGGLSFSSKIDITALQSSFLPYDLIDFDNDGDLDIFYMLGDDELKYIENLGGNNNFQSEVDIPNILDKTNKFFFEDFDRDGDPDLFTHSYLDEALYLHQNFYDEPSISGVTYLDENENGIFDNNEFAIYLQPINISPAEIGTFSSPNGYFEFIVDTGFYNLICNPIENFALTTPQNLSVEINDNSNTQIEFGLKPTTAFLQSTIDMTSAPTRCGFQVPFWIDYQNNGTLNSNGVVELVMDSLVSFVESNPLPDSIVGNSIYWSFENLLPTYVGQIELTLQMPGVDFLGEWLSMPVSVDMISVDGTQMDRQIVGFRSQINCAYDPNDKLVEPDIPGDDNYVLFGDTLEYTVRFQNTGTDTAFTVRVEDYLDADLDWNSLRVLGTSHDYKVTLDQTTGLLVFTFENIMLPDSSVNEIKSHGYFRYQIQHKVNIQENTFIENYASIFFDFNPPIITNTVENILVSKYPIELEIMEPTCFGENDGSIKVLNDLLFYESYEWDNNVTGLDNQNIPAGVYHLTIITTTGESVDTIIQLNQPSILSIVDVATNVSCFNEGDGSIEIIPIGATPEYTIVWNNGSSGFMIDQLPPGEYIATVTDANECIMKDTFFIIQPDELITDSLVTDGTCFDAHDGSIELTTEGGTNPYTYLWSNNSTNANQSQLSPGNYTVTITDASQCTNVLNFTITSLPEIFVTVSTNSEFENNMDGSASVQVSGGNPPYTYAWNTSITETDSILTNLSAGEYSVIITDANNCTIETVVMVEQTTSLQNISEEVVWEINPNPSLGKIKIEVDLKNTSDWEIKIVNQLGQNISAFPNPIQGTKGKSMNLELKPGVYIAWLIINGESVSEKKIVVIE